MVLNSKSGGWLPRPLLDDCLVSAERRGKHTEHTTHLCWLNHLNISLKCTETTQSHSLDQDSDHFLNSIRVERCTHIWCQENSLCYSVFPQFQLWEKPLCYGCSAKKQNKIEF